MDIKREDIVATIRALFCNLMHLSPFVTVYTFVTGFFIMDGNTDDYTIVMSLLSSAHTSVFFTSLFQSSFFRLSIGSSF